jgi:2-polyprenyl-3-methyl-5-hydroxy-6-metoxy-1,4-benzoquinol methylase
VTIEADAVIGIYERHAIAFDRLRSKTLMEKPFLDSFAALLPAGATVLDIGCGSGDPIAANLIERGFALTGIDSSATLINLCRSCLPGAEWHVTDMRHLSLDRRFAGLIAWHSLFHLTMNEQRQMFQRFAEHAEPDAVLMFTSGPSEAVAIGSFEGEPLFHASLSADEYRRLLGEHSFEVVEHSVETPDCGGATIWLAKRCLKK